ncbi:MAG: GYF domain-containing protein [Verrucomicrobiota bacterium]
MWFYSKDQQQQGPVEADEIRQRLKAGELSNATLVWKEGMANWTPLGDVLELREPVPVTPSPEGEVTPSAASPLEAASRPYTAPAAPVQPVQLTAPVEQNTMALVSMILGILALLCFGILTGLPAVICGHLARGQIRRASVPQTGGGMALTGLILGYISIVFSVIAIVFVVIGAMSEASSMPTPMP